jgi:acetyl-CoA carboxylase carboxyl transferase subunit alpha
MTLEFEKPIRDLENKIEELKQLANGGLVDFGEEIQKLERKARRLQIEIFSDLTPWQVVQLSRHSERPYFLDYVALLFTDFVELHGDRRFADDQSLVGGLARFDGEPVLVLGHQKGRSTKENMLRNFGMPCPEGYRKAMRLMQLADRFNLPVLTFIDTQGAYPGIGAEERGQAEAIAASLEAMAGLGVPVIATVIGEGGSGGALAIGVGNRILMLQHSIYSVISPESCSSILYRDPSKAEKMAESLKLTAADLKSFGVIDEVVPEAQGGAHRDPARTAENLGRVLRRHLGELRGLASEALVEDRYRRFRSMGVFERTTS